MGSSVPIISQNSPERDKYLSYSERDKYLPYSEYEQVKQMLKNASFESYN